MDLYKIRNELMTGKSIYDLPLRVTFYARVSTDRDEQLNSLENQKMYFEKYIKDVTNWTYVNGYIDEGISGTSVLKRENFMRMIDDGKNGKFDLVLTKEVSRFARNTLDSIKYTQDLLSYGVGVIFHSDNINTILPDSELRLTIMASVAQEEVRKMSERVQFGLKRSVDKEYVLGNSRIWGYRVENGRLYIDEEQAKMVRELFTLYATGDYGFYTVSNMLYEKGYMTSNGTFFQNTALKNMIQNPKYKGLYRTNTVRTIDYKTKKVVYIPKDEWVVFECADKDKIPPIVSEELWEKANAVLDKRSKSIMDKRENKDVFKHRYAYSGILYCAEHNTTLHRSAGTKRRDRPIWACSKYLRSGLKGCTSPILAEKELDIVFKHILENVIDQKSVIIDGLLALYEKAHSQHDYNVEIKGIEQKQERIRQKKDKLLELSIDGFITKQEYQKRNEELNNNIYALNNELDIIDEEIRKAKLIKSDMDYIKQEMLKETNFSGDISDFVNLLIDRVYVSKIDNDRNRIKLDIILKFGNPLEINASKSRNGGFEFSFVDNECLLSADKGRN
jgi:DNA invertase Pin-like site-specific DNA recombinase